MGMRGAWLGLGIVVVGAGATAAGCTESSSSPTPATTGTDADIQGDGGAAGTDAPATLDAKPPEGGTRTDGVVREIVYRQITHATTAADFPTSVPVISGNGKRIAFAVAPGTQSAATPNRIFVIDADGTNLKQVDSYKTNCFCGSDIAISDDGNTIVSTDSTQVRVVDTAGTLKGSFTLDNNVVTGLALNATGTDVFFINARDSNQTLPSATPRARGTYTMKSNGTGITAILTPQTVAPLVGKTAAEVFPFAGCGTSLAVSSDGTKVFSVVNVLGAQAIIASSGTGTGAALVLGPVTTGDKLVYAVATNQNGSKAAYWTASAAPAGGEIGVMGADGTNKTKLFDIGAGGGCRMPFTMSGDGSKVALSVMSTVFPTDGSEPWPLLIGTGFFSSDPAFVGSPNGPLSMAADGKTFVYVNSDAVGKQIAVAELDPASVGAAPKVTEPKVSPAEIPHDLSVAATMEARVSGTPIRVGGQVFYKGLLDSNAVHADKVLLPDAGVYVAGGVNASTNATPGPRILRIKAEAKDGSGLRSAHAVDFGPFTIK